MINLLARVLPRSMLTGFTISATAKVSRFCFSAEKPVEGIYAEQFPANEPIEDRLRVLKMDNPKGYYFAVFDGHGGEFVSQYVNNTLPGVLEQKLKSMAAPDDQEAIKRSIAQSFETVEASLLKIVKENNNVRTITSGSCALVSVLINRTLYVANSGDCEGIIVKEDGSTTKINRRHNIAEPQQKARLKRLFPGENDIAVTPLGGGCYLKGRLQPTYSFGDFYLKYKEFNLTGIRQFTGPYVQHRPEITTFNIAANDKYLVLATDGLWDQYSHEEVAKILLSNPGMSSPGKHLITTALDKISATIGVRSDQLIKVRNRRNLHDDISLIVVDLKSL